MRRQRRFVLMMAMVAAAATSALGQTPMPTVGPANGNTRGAVSIPNLSGIWAHPSAPGFEPPPSGPGPVLNKSRRKQVFDGNGRRLPPEKEVLVSDTRRLVGDYTNPILKAEAAAVVKKHGEISLAGVAYPTPRTQCWPGGVPFIFWNFGMQLVQQPDKIIILYFYDHEFRQVRINESHLEGVTPSWYGDSVGHYEGDTLVIDTVGVKVGPFAMVDQFGTPHTDALHVVERYRLLDYQAAKEGLERDAKENFRVPGSDVGPDVDPNYMGKALQLHFTVEDEGVFTTPWSATITYRRALDGPWEIVCSENPHVYYTGKDSAVPRADKPDF